MHFRYAGDLMKKKALIAIALTVGLVFATSNAGHAREPNQPSIAPQSCSALYDRVEFGVFTVGYWTSILDTFWTRKDAKRGVKAINRALKKSKNSETRALLRALKREFRQEFSSKRQSTLEKIEDNIQRGRC